VAFVGQSVAAGVAQHVWVGLEPEVRLGARPLDHAREAGGREWRASLRGEYEGRPWLLVAV